MVHYNLSLATAIIDPMSHPNSNPTPNPDQSGTSGFSAQSQMGLPEVLQMCCLSRRSGQITFRSGESYGFIYIQHGRVLHAHDLNAAHHDVVVVLHEVLLKAESSVLGYELRRDGVIGDGQQRDGHAESLGELAGDLGLGRPLGEGFKLADVLRDVARHYLSRALKEADGNLTKASSLVGLANYQTLKNWLGKYEVEG